MNKQKTSTIFVTAVISVISTVAIGAVIISVMGFEEVEENVSPLVAATKNRVTKGVVPETKRVEAPKSKEALLMEAVEKNRGNVVSIYAGSFADATKNNLENQFVARGIVFDEAGWIVTDASVIDDDMVYTVIVPGVKEGFLVKETQESGDLLLLKIEKEFSVIPTFDVGSKKNNELVVAISGEAEVEVHSGVTIPNQDSAEKNVVSTTIISGIAPGSPLVSNEGDVIGISLAGREGDNGGQVFHVVDAKL